ncbi:hypothetical protein FRX31_009471 [Thalictrum thalictroides]|uniref:Replication protein A 70 kDa DNA-binding subunit B/D first OB fold domain-containing protein n=1 Tax=Thalictrum thalictroides TaxID=46969 RepID=A0A7J6WXU6_THATH|nr:hypothetical protein FRX31_009471 [Thalictrum thalictroides]
MTKYQKDLQEGNIYEISNFDIEKNTQDYRPVAHTYKIKFTSETNITEVDNDESIPRYNFKFTALATGLTKLGQKTWLMGKY